MIKILEKLTYMNVVIYINYINKLIFMLNVA